jgi:hypothetical protein
MGVTTWLDRITDESNLWLSATKAEDSKDYATASLLYLEDAVACLDRNSLVRGALSCSCAADSLGKLGASAEAKRLYLEAGGLYASLADHGISGSIREALWALQRAHACFVLGGHIKEAQTVLESFDLLARRANPFDASPFWSVMPKVSPVKLLEPDGKREVPAEVIDAVERLIAARERIGEKDLPAKRKVGRFVDGQESIVSQLG